MDVEGKCRLSAEHGGCVGFLEGTFVRFYQQGLFTWNSFTDTPLKVCGRQVKKLNGTWLLSGGLPLASFLAQKIDAKIYKWGAVLDMAWENEKYEFWYQKEVNRLSVPSYQPTITTQILMEGNDESLTFPLNTLFHWGLFTSTKKEQKMLIRKIRKEMLNIRLKESNDIF
ncbi:hypothetical protein ACTZGB_09735 [Yersinia bercovieri]|uniref:Uncharacterized protein n=3 Tax=Yersinia bercovieri TaxID=634 RepID=A0A2G4TXN3_YERBE|nr:MULTISPECIES: hypothetical protein [Yersinia]EEQ07718.1 hypothetical protein yberc0001_32830 [Yersinia bercovieri ATCC 43970]MCB5304132.1 hypothetical protein [Yersinia bercovieri]MDN0101422.1 hypothetical protein [Yersinia bercovieri]PHZ25818.1 hypothetical protein CS533_19515 [Yersinia bercovieri]QDW32217.1 hypothetical protein FFE93_003590 [Yersinia sp. KBS0713]